MRIIIIGSGEVGYNIAIRLIEEGKDVAILEPDRERVRLCRNTLDALVIEGSGSNPEDLKEAGIQHAAMVIAVTHSDEVNITSCLLASVLAPQAIRVARIRNHAMSQLPELFGPSHLALDLTIHPESLAAEKIQNLLRCHGAIDHVSFAEGKINVIAISIPPDSPLAGQTFAELGQSQWSQKVLVAAVEHNKQLIIPKGEYKIHAHDTLYVVTTPDSVREIMTLVGHNQMETSSVMLYGSSYVGLTVAKSLVKKNVEVKIIEPDKNSCDLLADDMPSAIILNGDGTDEALLQSENISEMDAFLACSNDEESNILAALLAQRMGAKNVFVVTNKMSFISLISSIGVDIVISPRLMAVGSIMQFIRRGRVMSVMPFYEDAAEAIEFLIPENSSIIGNPLQELKFPKGAIIAAIVRNAEVIIPSGNTTIEPNDHVLVFTLRKAVSKVEKVLSARAK